MTDPIAVLVVEDDEEDYLLTRELLDDLDADEYVIRWVDNYEAGLEELLSGNHDVCLVDYSLGERTGLELLREAIARECKIPILFLTGRSDRESVVEVMRAGAADYLVKGAFNAQQLQRSIRYALERSRSLRALRKLHAELEEAREQARDLEVIRRQNVELDRLATELEASRRMLEARAQELAASNERLRERERENQRLIERLRELVAQLSTPVLRVWKDVLALPIIGKIDRDRADAITTRALHEIAAQRVRYVVLDLTGVSDVDAETINHLESLAQAARLLGVRCFVCGLTPAIVRSMAEFSGGKHEFEAVRDLHETLVLIASLRAGA
ncbi:MAG TPA: response regulator [Nannocystis sp.]